MDLDLDCIYVKNNLKYLDLDFIYEICQYLDLDLQVVDLCPPLLLASTANLAIVANMAIYSR